MESMLVDKMELLLDLLMVRPMAYWMVESSV